MFRAFDRRDSQGDPGRARQWGEDRHRECGKQLHHNPQQAVEYLDAINSEWVGWHFDIGNAGRYGPAEAWIPRLGSRLVRLHIKEFNTKAMASEPGKKGSGSGFKLLEGDTNWPAIMTALDKVGYKGWAISEQPGHNAGSVEAAHDLAERMDKIFAS